MKKLHVRICDRITFFVKHKKKYQLLVFQPIVGRKNVIKFEPTTKFNIL